MAIIRETSNSENDSNYIVALFFLCILPCVTLMLKLGGFKASLKLYGWKRNDEHEEIGTTLSINGAYRTNRDDSFEKSPNTVRNNFHERLNSHEPLKRLTPSMVQLPPTSEQDQLRPVKSTNDLTKIKNLPPHLRQSTPNVSLDPRGAQPIEPQTSAKQSSKDKKNQEKEQKKLEKQRQAQQKVQEKEQAKQEKLRKEKEKLQKTREKKIKKSKASAPQATANPLGQGSTQNTSQYSTNTLNSSISRSSGPPPYAEVPTQDIVQLKEEVDTNISFSKPVDTGSWDMITQHRQQINRPTTATRAERPQKQMVMDLNYSFGENAVENRDNSEA